jgi:hypothetical protein
MFTARPLPLPVLVALALVAAPVQAEEAQPAAPAAQSEATAPLEAVVRGLFVEARVGGGYMVTGQNVPDDERYYIGLRGKSEQLGPGALMHLALGIDLVDVLAFQVVGGSTVVSGTRTDRVRDLGLVFGGAGLRLSLPAGDRLNVVIGAAGVYVRSDDGVAPAQTGAGGFANLGLEYFVHVRHFSVGIDLSVLAPFTPQRLFVGLGPQIKYTF